MGYGFGYNSQFADVGFVGRERLERIVATDKPYRDSKNAYPYGDRKYSARHFRVLENGDYEIWHMSRTTVDDYLGGKHPEHDYRKWGLVGIVRADNTFEFTKPVGQSESMLLTEAMNASVYNNARLGGAIYTKNDRMHPIFRGMRVDLKTGDAVTPYTTVHHTLKRKEARELDKQHNEFRAVYKAMLDAMDNRGLTELMIDVMSENDIDNVSSADFSVVQRLIDEKKYLDAGLLFGAISTRTNWYISYALGSVKNEGRSIEEVANSYGRYIKDAANWNPAKFRKALYKHSPQVFTTEERTAGTKLTEATWGFDTIVDGKVAERL
jgi:hypothetical protein